MCDDNSAGGLGLMYHRALPLLVILMLVSAATPDSGAAEVASTAGAAVADAAVADAAERGDWAAVERLVADKADARADQPDGMTALHWSVFHSNPATTRRLIEASADVNAVTRYGITPLTIACTAGDSRLVRMLLEAGANPKQAGAGGETPLMTASRTGRVEPVRWLLEAGADPNTTERRCQTALMWAAAEGHADVVDALIDAGADPHVTLDSGFTAMLFAAREGRVEAAMRLLDAGADVNLVMHPEQKGGRAPREGMSALMLAVESGHFELAVKLVERGADPNDQRSGFTPLHALTWTRKANLGDGVDGDPIPRGSGRLTSEHFVRAVVALGADVNRRLERGKGGRAQLTLRGATPFLMAAKTADLPLMQLLHDLGADPHLTNADGTTPLMATAGIGVTAVGEEAGTEPEVLETVKWLLERGLDINAVDDNGETAMHGAAYRNYPQVVALLANRGADAAVWDRENRYGWTPTLIAQGNRPGSFKPSPETIAALEKARRVPAAQ